MTFLEIAERIGARLCRDAVWYQGQCNWTADFLDGESIAHGALGPELYDGSSGIALFLWRLAELTGERIFRVTAEAALRETTLSGCGLYSGGLGVLSVAAEIRPRFDVRTLLVQLAEPDRSKLDVMDGSAGAIAVLLRFGLHEAAARHGDLLIEEASRADQGWSWRTIDPSRNLTGFSHGASGIAWALLELYHATGEQRFRTAALEALRYSRQADPSDPVSWCHGSAGIGFCRLRAWQILGDEELLADARAALQTTRDQSPYLTNFSLCHGQAGNADLMIYASELLGEESWLSLAESVAQEGFDRFEKRRIPWPCGLPDANETPDLMLGLAGIGYFYLRLAAPAKIPSVLLPQIKTALQ